MRRVLACAALAVTAACVGRPPLPSPAPAAPTLSIEQLAAAIAAAAKRSDGEIDSAQRADLAAEATRDADECIARAPKAVACLYGHALALGLDARVHPIRAAAQLSSMLASLTDAQSLDPTYDEAGPERVRALVLIRAPGWPLGPGDPDEGLAAARRATALRPDYPPNQLALAEALQKTGAAADARRIYAKARELALARPPSAQREEWLRDADKGLNQ